ncbi:PREDICTED: interleukin-32 isoform X2 [Myotis brandtii]|uniref:interleukin-32 isoform X2 n=1 Tax=Myotis brandtii TaxID=109478 RepID=UPI000703F031|nr:PREDICTED: interleukin-32 isoform X2 [Myotis brandtii]
MCTTGLGVGKSYKINVTVTSTDIHKKLRSEMLKAVNTFCDKVKPEEEDQESTPLLPEQQQELRNRVRSRVRPGQKPGPEWDPEPEGSHNQSPGAQKPWESFCEWIMRLFQKMLSRLQKMWQDVVAWVQEKWASFVSVVKSIWIDIKDFCSRVAQYFSS